MWIMSGTLQEYAHVNDNIICNFVNDIKEGKTLLQLVKSF